jgi:hypothetical protein
LKESIGGSSVIILSSEVGPRFGVLRSHLLKSFFDGLEINVEPTAVVIDGVSFVLNANSTILDEWAVTEEWGSPIRNGDKQNGTEEDT